MIWLDRARRSAIVLSEIIRVVAIVLLLLIVTKVVAALVLVVIGLVGAWVFASMFTRL